MYELAKADNANERQLVISYVNQLNPLYLSNNSFIKRQELLQFLARRGKLSFRAEVVQALNESVARMWTTYSGVVFLDDSFGNYVEYLSRHKGERDEIHQQAMDTPRLISDARKVISG
jgi:hypothetical protein